MKICIALAHDRNNQDELIDTGVRRTKNRLFCRIQDSIILFDG